MANPHKGEADLQVGDKTYVLCLTTNAIAEIEALLDNDIVSVMIALRETTRVGTLRAMLWGGLRKYQPSLSLFDAGDIIDEMGTDGLEQLGAKLGEAIRFRVSGAVAK